MVPLMILLGVTLLSGLVRWLLKKKNVLINSARLGMSCMLLFTAAGHFIFPEGMALMIPRPIPFKSELVFITGFAEIFAAIGLQLPKYRKLTGWLLIVFFLFMLPANVYASVHEINYRTATYDGYGMDYLWFRIPLQLLFIGWTYFTSIKNIAK